MFRRDPSAAYTLGDGLMDPWVPLRTTLTYLWWRDVVELLDVTNSSAELPRVPVVELRILL
jgi:hypothetical protein